MELTDGWYPIKAVLDKPLSYLVQAGKIEIGTKLCIYGANLVGAEQAVPPLEVTLRPRVCKQVILKVMSNLMPNYC